MRLRAPAQRPSHRFPFSTRLGKKRADALQPNIEINKRRRKR